jgi:flagellar FliL protein
MAEDKQKETASGGSGALKVKSFLMIGFVVLNLAVTLGGAGLVYMATLGAHETMITEEQEQVHLAQERKNEEFTPITFTMEPFTVNLDGLPSRMIQTEITLEMLDEEGFEEVVRLGAQARDSIVKILNSKNYSDLETIQGKLFLKDEIATQLNVFLKTGVVKEVYFQKCAVQ